MSKYRVVQIDKERYQVYRKVLRVIWWRVGSDTSIMSLPYRLEIIREEEERKNFKPVVVAEGDIDYLMGLYKSKGE